MKSRYYKILGLPENASLSDVRKQYRKLVMQYHPDRNKSPNAEERFIEIKEAYEILTGKKEPPRHYSGTRQPQKQAGNASEQAKANEAAKRAKEAELRFKEQKMREFIENELYFRKLTQGYRWKMMKVSAIVGIILAIVLSLDLFLPRHYQKDRVVAFNANTAFGIGGKRVSLISTQKNGKFWIEHFNSSLYYGDHRIEIESSWLMHNPIRILKQDKVRMFGFPINFNIFRVSFLLIPLFLLPAFTIRYKRRKISFTVLYHFCFYGVNGIMLFVIASGDRWAHLLTFGFL
jgi:curved DNA-binding protein CbpA